MNNVTIYLLLAFFAAFILYFQIQKLTKKLDDEGAVPAYQKATQEVLENLSNAEKYPKFCNVIFKKINALRQDILFEDTLNSESEKDKTLDALEQIREKLETLSKQENLSWESELFTILDELDGFVRANFKDGEDRAEELREELKREFDGL
ncbi:aryl-sulfate sulfotransferase [Campylobacter concisus]|uniref:Aryl-sulfate sulfotransferase n=1 Tax=Campylobacter concisus TaxID=199 RepID=A0A1Y5MWN7_9BACT|nr:aryl-sulfate sulfotransferase [Campylobacter concisus]OUT11694.1 aryl-sulfate sulfotransferase [Campylobacter concisus]